MPLTPEEAVDTYLAAWNEPDPAKRGELLSVVWSESGTYQDPTSKTEGRMALADHIGAFQSRFPGARLELEGKPNSYNGQVLFTWVIAMGNGNSLIGHDYGTFNDGGQFQQVIGFFSS